MDLTPDDEQARIGRPAPLGMLIGSVTPAPGVPSGVDWAARDAAIESARARREAEDEAKRRESRLLDLAGRGLPEKDLERVMTGEGLVETAALAKARELVDGGALLAVLSGPPSLGKTTAATWWVLNARGKSRLATEGPLFVDAAALAAWSRFDKVEMRKLERATALVLDDCGVEYDDKQGAFRSFFDALVNRRYASCAPTLLTTNLDAAKFKARYHERIAERVRECGGFHPLRGDSLRGRR